MQERNPWIDFLAFSAGLAATTVIAASILIIDDYASRIIERLTPEELKLHKEELKRFFQPPEEPGESFAIEKPKPPSLPPSSALVFSPIKPKGGPGGSGAAAEVKIEREVVLTK